MRNISFALTKPQIVAQTKDVTRRLGWLHLKVGQLVQPVEKCMGLKPGESVVKIGGPILVVGVRREPLRMMTDDLDYGRDECRREGFPELAPHEFIEMFCRANKACAPETIITRIEFGYWGDQR